MSVLHLLRDATSQASAALSAAWYGPPLIDDPDGTEEDYRSRFDTSTDDAGSLLGEGAFGEVRLVRVNIGVGGANGGGGDSDQDGNGDKDVPRSNQCFASKILRKGYSIKHNVLYTPPLPGVLAREVRILRRLNGRHHTLRLDSVFEGSRFLYLVTELLRGGDLKDFRERCLRRRDDRDGGGGGGGGGLILSTEIVRDAATRLLDAVNHCAVRGVIHRDVKPANVMMVGCDGDAHTFTAAGLRLIDFGSGSIDDPPREDEGKQDPVRHTTMAGSAFYNSPEMFQRSYTYKTDVWSAGVTIYVFAAGFPDDNRMQECFDSMHRSPKLGNRKLKEKLLPPPPGEVGGGGKEPSLPDSFWKMLDESLLVYRHKPRKSAGDALRSCDFLRS